MIKYNKIMKKKKKMYDKNAVPVLQLLLCFSGKQQQ